MAHPLDRIVAKLLAGCSEAEFKAASCPKCHAPLHLAVSRWYRSLSVKCSANDHLSIHVEVLESTHPEWWSKYRSQGIIVELPRQHESPDMTKPDLVFDRYRYSLKDLFDFVKKGGRLLCPRCASPLNVAATREEARELKIQPGIYCPGKHVDITFLLRDDRLGDLPLTPPPASSL